MLIGEVSRRCGISTRMLRHYDAVGLLEPTGRTSGGYREYSAEDIRRLLHIETSRTLGLSLSETRRALDEPDFAPADLVSDLIRHTRRRIAAEEELLATLERVDAARPTEWEDVLRVVSLLRALESDSAAGRQQAVLAADADASLPVDALASAFFAEQDTNVAGALQWSLARAGSHGLADLVGGLDSADVEVRRRASLAITTVRTADATAALIRALGDSDGTVRGYAALALGSRGNLDAVPVLLEMVEVGRLDVEAAETLGSLADLGPVADRIVERLESTVDHSRDCSVRLRITQALAEIPGTAARTALSRLTADVDRTVAATATAILRMHSDRIPLDE